MLICIDKMHVAWAGSGLFGFFMACIFPTTLLMAEESVQLTGRYGSALVFASSVGEFIIPTGMGNILAGLGTFYFLWSVLIFILIIFIMLVSVHFCAHKIQQNIRIEKEVSNINNKDNNDHV
ncbi:hypothetical protein RFI_24579 [Reticulomyxa filosa]|uniref:Major facilitator superfamily (MFS) profile domain-containing protein n=1 Tax=Reticulomyxa filosa TaxID=46433 RepID=X6MGL6_RETFI|nr:hypothetical protein RFI_24579 [Reticulomyxa filosa]|eukprot:ETO12796.1 hypothetical protein RFI_24579 [Reticulomyxa filosa]